MIVVNCLNFVIVVFLNLCFRFYNNDVFNEKIIIFVVEEGEREKNVFWKKKNDFWRILYEYEMRGVYIMCLR